MSRTKIIATIGPASNSKETIKKMIKAGMTVARINRSHGTHKEHQQAIKNIRLAEKETGVPVAILLDLQGPKIRTGLLKNPPLKLNANEILTITTQQIVGNNGKISTTYKGLVRDVKKGSRILLDDGAIEMKVLSVGKSAIKCRILNSGWLGEHKGINLPGTKVSAPALTAKDKKDLLFGVRVGVDFIALSFVRQSQDIVALKNLLQKKKADIPVIAKIEKPEALTVIDDIIRVTDGVMIARGDLGVEISEQEVPLVQKEVIKKCDKAGRLVITATQMLESMILAPRPTRAEASDVANAVMDGTDALMLSGETAIGKYPVKAVETMRKIARVAEESAFKNKILERKTYTIAGAISHATCELAQDLKARAIITYTSSGSTAMLVSKYRTDAPIYAGSIYEGTRRRINLYWGITPLKIEKFKNTDDMINKMEKALVKKKLIQKGDVVVIVAGVPTGVPGTTNLIKAHRVE